MRSNTPARSFTADILRKVVGVASIAALSVTLSACVMSGDVNHAENSPEPSAAEETVGNSQDAAAQQPEVGPDGLDLSAGAVCANGEDGFIKGAGLEVSVSGKCGNVLVEGTDLKVTLEDAKTVAVRGENNSVTGANWDVVVIQGLNITADAKATDTVDINGKDIKFTSQGSRTVLISGEGLDATVGDATSIAVAGFKNKVVADTVSDSITVEGSQNDVAWTGGIAEETSVSGEANSFTRP